MKVTPLVIFFLPNQPLVCCSMVGTKAQALVDTWSIIYDMRSKGPMEVLKRQVFYIMWRESKDRAPVSVKP